jgi:hypothetical protein
MMILFVDMLKSEKYDMLNCFILNENLCAKANFETSINKDLKIQSLSSLFVEQGYYHTGISPGKIK